MTARRSFPCQPEAIAEARRFVRDSLAGHPSETIEIAELMTSELASNCVRHAQTGFDLVVRSAGEIRIESHDRGPGSPSVRSPTPREAAGRGLQIVAAMSSDWGVVPTAEGKQVWFTLPVGSAAEAPSRRTSAQLESADAPSRGPRKRVSSQPPAKCGGRSRSPGSRSLVVL